MLFEEGVGLAEKGDWIGAEDRYRRALSLRGSPVIAYNLASALSEQGKLVEASEVLRRVLVDDAADAQLRHAASQLDEGIAARIARIQVSVRGMQLGDSVVLDGKVLHAAQLSVEIPVDPGDHQLRLERSGATLDMQSLSLEPGGRAELALVAPALAPMPQLAADPNVSEPAQLSGATLRKAEHEPPRAEGRSLLTRWWFWTGAAALVAVGTVAGVAAATSGRASEQAFQGNLAPGSLQVEVAP